MTAWMEIAEGELGQAEVPGSGDNPRIREYHASASDGHEMADSVPWCSSFCGFVLQEAGITGTGNRMARSYLKWGTKLDTPKFGCVVVLRRGNDPNSGHVGFFHSRAKGRVFLLGGNQGDKVSVQGFPESQVIGYRWPEQAAPPPEPTVATLRAEGSKEIAVADAVQKGAVGVGTIGAVAGGASQVETPSIIPAVDPSVTHASDWTAVLVKIQGGANAVIKLMQAHWWVGILLGALVAYLVGRWWKQHRVKRAAAGHPLSTEV